MDAQIEGLNKETQQLQSEVNNLTTKHKQLQSNMTLQEAKDKLKLTNTEVVS